MEIERASSGRWRNCSFVTSAQLQKLLLGFTTLVKTKISNKYQANCDCESVFGDIRNPQRMNSNNSSLVAPPGVQNTCKTNANHKVNL